MTEPSYLQPVRESYDTVAADYIEHVKPPAEMGVLARAMLAAFAEHVRADHTGPVADLGCGPGRVTAHLADLGVTAFGVDLSPKMIELAHAAYPDLEFHAGSMTALDIPDRALGGILAWYSTVHTPPSRLPKILAECHRTLAPGGYLLIGFKADGETTHLSHAYGHDVDLDVYRIGVDSLAHLLGQAGLTEQTRLVCQPDPGEKSPQAFLIAHKPQQPDSSHT